VFDQDERRRVLAEARDNIERLKDGPKRPFAQLAWGNPPPPDEDEAPPPAWPTASGEPLATVPRVSCEAQDRYVQQAEQQAAIFEAQRRVERARQNERQREAMEASAQATAQAEETLRAIAEAAIASELTQLDRVVGDALVDVGARVLEQVDQKIAALRKELMDEIGLLRAEVNVNRAIDKSTVIELPPFLAKRAS
jgi:hypothetical protein